MEFVEWVKRAWFYIIPVLIISGIIGGVYGGPVGTIFCSISGFLGLVFGEECT